MYSSTDAAPMCTLLEQSDNYSWRFTFQRFGEYRNNVVTNAVVLVLGECQISINGNVPPGVIYPHIKLCCNVFVIDNGMLL